MEDLEKFIELRLSSRRSQGERRVNVLRRGGSVGCFFFLGGGWTFFFLLKGVLDVFFWGVWKRWVFGWVFPPGFLVGVFLEVVGFGWVVFWGILESGLRWIQRGSRFPLGDFCGKQARCKKRFEPIHCPIHPVALGYCNWWCERLGRMVVVFLIQWPKKMLTEMWMLKGCPFEVLWIKHFEKKRDIFSSFHPKKSDASKRNTHRLWQAGAGEIAAELGDLDDELTSTARFLIEKTRWLLEGSKEVLERRVLSSSYAGSTGPVSVHPLGVAQAALWKPPVQKQRFFLLDESLPANEELLGVGMNCVAMISGIFGRLVQNSSGAKEVLLLFVLCWKSLADLVLLWSLLKTTAKKPCVPLFSDAHLTRIWKGLKPLAGQVKWLFVAVPHSIFLLQAFERAETLKRCSTQAWKAWILSRSRQLAEAFFQKKPNDVCQRMRAIWDL